MTVFKIKFGDISINVVEIAHHHVFTIYLWNSDWYLRSKIWKFAELNPSCCLITKHDESSPEHIYHAEDELRTQQKLRTVSTYLKYHREITPAQFNEFLDLIVANGRASLTSTKRIQPTEEELKKIFEWKRDAIIHFKSWYDKNHLNVTKNTSDSKVHPENKADIIYYSRAIDLR